MQRERAVNDAELHTAVAAEKKKSHDFQKQLIEIRTEHDRLILQNRKLKEDAQIAGIRVWERNSIFFSFEWI